MVVEILSQMDFHLPDAPRPKNEIEILNFNGSTESFEKLDLILSENNISEEASFSVDIDDQEVCLKIRRKKNKIKIILLGTPSGYYFAIQLRHKKLFTLELKAEDSDTRIINRIQSESRNTGGKIGKLEVVKKSEEYIWLVDRDCNHKYVAILEKGELFALYYEDFRFLYKDEEESVGEGIAFSWELPDYKLPRIYDRSDIKILWEKFSGSVKDKFYALEFPSQAQETPLRLEYVRRDDRWDLIDLTTLSSCANAPLLENEVPSTHQELAYAERSKSKETFENGVKSEASCHKIPNGVGKIALRTINDRYMLDINLNESYRSFKKSELLIYTGGEIFDEELISFGHATIQGLSPDTYDFYINKEGQSPKFLFSLKLPKNE